MSEEVVMDASARARRWIKKMTDVPPVKGHAYKRVGVAAYCECGDYLGGRGSF